MLCAGLVAAGWLMAVVGPAHAQEAAVQWTHLSSAEGDLPVPGRGDQQTATAVLDVDKDGTNDFMIAERTEAPSVVWYRRGSDGWTRYVVDDEALPIEAGSATHDIDGDGDRDVVFGGDAQSNRVWWWENPYPDFDSTASWERHLIAETPGGKHHDQLFVDADGDGQAELVFWNQGAQRLYLAEIPDDPQAAQQWETKVIYAYSSDSQMEQRGSYPGWRDTNEHEGLYAADVDGNDTLDVVGGGRWFARAGSGGFRENIVDASYPFSRSAVGDLIEGGRPEVVLGVGDGRGPLMLYEHHAEGSEGNGSMGAGTWGATTLIDTVQDGHSLDVVDFNGDGHLDIFVAEMRLGENPDAKTWILLGDGQGGFTRTVVSEGYGLHEARIADLDGDGDYDILGKPYTWEAPRLDVWINEGTAQGEGTSQRRRPDGDDSPRWFGSASHRLPIQVGAAGYARRDKPVEVELNAEKRSGRPAATASRALQPVRVVEVSEEGTVVDENVTFQFDGAAGPGAKDRAGAAGTLVFMMKGPMPADATRHFEVYLGAADSASTLAGGPAPVRVTDHVEHEGQESFEIHTPSATYYYHKKGAGFASLEDRDGHDWISHHPGNGSAGAYRGIPNLVYPEGHFHPGATTSTSTLLSRGPIRARIYSETRDGQWAASWSIYPAYATMTLHRADSSYWFLYEGTPGGSLEPEEDVVVRSTGQKTPASASWAQDLPAPEWLYFADGRQDRSLFVAHHGDDDASDQFWPMEGNMTVLGFGREHRCCGTYLTAVPAQFTIGLLESRAFAEASAAINAAYRKLEVQVGPLEERTSSPPGRAAGAAPEARSALPLDQWTHIRVDSTRTPYPGRSGAGWWFGLDMADVTGDGYKDIVSGQWFYRNPGGDMAQGWTRIDHGAEADALLFADVDGDEYGDVIATALPAVYWLEARDRAGRRWKTTEVAQLPETDHGNGQGYETAQLVPGGKPEILLSAGEGIEYLQIPDAPEEQPWPATRMAPAAYDEGIGVGDFDGDGDQDVVGGERLPGGEPVPGTNGLTWGNSRVAWWENPGRRGEGNWRKHPVGEATQADRFEVGDLNGDGRPDIVTSEERYPGEEPNASLYWYEAPADPEQQNWRRHRVAETYSLNNLDVADLDQDGDLDLVTNEHKGPHHRTLIFENDGAGHFARHLVDRGKESHLGTQAEDLDQDGDLDVVSIAWDTYENLHLWRNDAMQDPPRSRP